MLFLKVGLYLLGIFSQNLAAENLTTPRNSKHGNEECSEMTNTHGYGYSKFYHVTHTNKNNNHEFELKFKVMAKSNAHILLTPAAQPKIEDPVYEIVLGAGHNSFSDIRRLQRSNSKNVVRTPDLLSMNNTRAFWVRLSHDGILQVGMWGEDLPFLTWQDPDPLPIQYFSFATWANIWGTWRFNCIGNSSSELSDEKIEEVIRPLSMHEKLRRDLLTDYDPMAHPNKIANQRTTVFMELLTHKISIQWTDEKLAWNPDDYENLTQLHIERHEIWQPEIVLYNAASSHGTDILGIAALTADFDGIVTWNPTTHMDTWCDLDLSDWPNDQQICQIQLGVWSEDQLLELALMANKNVDTEQRTGSEWDLVNMISETTWTKTPWKNLESDSGSAVPFSAITLQFTLKRKVFGILSIIPFWMSPHSTTKLTVLGVNILLLSMFLIGVGVALPAPANHLPNIVLAYILGMVSVIFSIGITILGICLVRYKQTEAPPLLIRTFLTAHSTRKILFLPEVLYPANGLFQDVSSCTTSSRTAEEIAQHWLIVVKAMDRAMCLINTIFWAMILAQF